MNNDTMNPVPEELHEVLTRSQVKVIVQFLGEP